MVWTASARYILIFISHCYKLIVLSAIKQVYFYIIIKLVFSYRKIPYIAWKYVILTLCREPLSEQCRKNSTSTAPHLLQVWGLFYSSTLFNYEDPLQVWRNSLVLFLISTVTRISLGQDLFCSLYVESPFVWGVRQMIGWINWTITQYLFSIQKTFKISIVFENLSRNSVFFRTKVKPKFQHGLITQKHHRHISPSPRGCRELSTRSETDRRSK